ncbi:phosphatidylinositol 4-phosphate 3-kinase C2 domain-containing subunit alpha-like [Littorina saxatilis]|uniref:phosphatidylinositol 4-phosphate 3-kinase C2 domain-containing subunit alpha-like n=1 Tax=Littorina saxatilis TaxID=31220 RepID=UPI0038B4F3AA
MASPGRQDGIPALQPPPIPPRRRSPIPTEQGAQVAGFIPPIPPRKVSTNQDVQSSGARFTLSKTHSLHTADSALMGFDANQPPRPYSIEVSGNQSRFLEELQGIDFTGTIPEASGLTVTQRSHSSSMEDLTPKPTDSIYPDISGAFRDLRTSTAKPPVYPVQAGYGAYPPNMGVGGGYGWNASLYDARSSPAFGASSNMGPAVTTGTSPVPGVPQTCVSAFPGNGGFQGNGGASAAFPRAGINGGASFYSGGLGFSGLGQPANTFYGINSSSGGGAMGNGHPATSQFLNLQVSMPKAASWGNMLELDRSGVEGLPAEGGAEQTAEEAAEEFDENSDLIEFKPGLPEHEYLSLDFFDPLYERGRKESVSVHDNRQHYTFGEAFPTISGDKRPPPELRRHIRKESNEIWGVSTSQKQDPLRQSGPIGFEVLTAEQMFGTSDEDFLQSHQQPQTHSAAGPPRPPPPAALEKKKEETARYEKLRKRTFIDAESDAFCQMVAELKSKYTSKEEKTNLGYLLSPIHTTHTPSLQIKVVIHLPFDPDPVAFTCDTNTLVEHVISQVLYSASPTHGQQRTAADFVLKVYDRAEYLDNNLPLSKFEYVHHCLKLDQDMMFELVTREQVIRPFIRTVDDDMQMLYFPREYIKTDDEAVSQDCLDILLDIFYKAVDRLNNQALQGGIDRGQLQSFSQSVKAICAILAKIETISISKALDRLERIVTDMASPSNRAGKMMGEGGSSADRDTMDAINVAIRCSLVEDLQEVIDQVISGVRQLVRMYCQTYHTDFFLGLGIDIPHNQTEVTAVQDNFIVHIATAHRLPSIVQNPFEDFKVVCSLYHGTHRLHADIVTSCQKLNTTSLCDRVVWDEWLQFDVSLSKLPREMRLCMTLVGMRYVTSTAADKSQTGDSNPKPQMAVPIGAAAIQLYNHRGHLLQGSHLVPMTMGVAADPTMPSCKTLLPNSILLQVNLPEFDKTIYFPPVVNTNTLPGKSFEGLVPELQRIVNNILEKDYIASLTAEEMETVWKYRHYLYSKPTALPRILQAKGPHGWDWASLTDLRALLDMWPPLHPTQAFELLLPQYPDLGVRKFAAESLARIPSDDLSHFLPQLIQALKFESYHNSPLACLLLETSCKSIRFAHQFFWLLKGVAGQEASYKRRYELMFAALANVAGDTLYQEFRKQEELVKIVTSVAEKVKVAKDKEATLKRDLQSIYEYVEQKGRLLLPYNPSLEVTGLDMKSCSYFASNAFPLKLVFKNSNPKADPLYVMYKVGDDLRQDMLTLQVIRIMDMLWLQEGLDLKMLTFSCLATGPKRGVVELITESETLRKIQVSSGVTGSFKDRTIKEWLQRHNPTELEYNKAVENFMFSCAGYCVATYVLGIGDRHNDNIMLKQSGHMFHIDFSKFLGDAQMFGNIKRDRVPFVLTPDMAYVINDGGKQDDRFQQFIDLCCQSFNILRRHADLFRNLFMLMSRSGIPGVTEHAVMYVQRALLPGNTNAQASAAFTRMIQDSMKSLSTQFNFFIHNLAQMKFSSHSEGALLSFVPKTYSLQTDGKIAKVSVHRVQKRYTPEKHYVYILQVERENQRVPTYVFRHFSEFMEFRDKLSTMFPLVTWQNFSTRYVIGRSNIRTVAQSRKTEIEQFLHQLWSTATEISECDLVYTFFHPLLRDEQEAAADKTNLDVPKLREIMPVPVPPPSGNTGIQGEIKLSVQYKHDALQVMVMHVKDLARSAELPSPYVKTYLLPDPEKQTKRKTKTAKSTVHPTYNEVLQYRRKESEIRHRTLQVTVWDHDMLKENNFLGAVYIRLRDLDLAKETTQWYPLQKLQLTGSGGFA